MSIRWLAVGIMVLMTALSFGDTDSPEGRRQAAAASPAPVSVPPSGDEEGFHYERVDSTPDVYAVTFSGNGQTVLVSDSFLALIMNHKGMTPEIKCKALLTYPTMVADNFGTIMDTTFPDHTQAPAEPFEGFECEGPNGSYITVSQDALAAPYVRVMVRDKTGMTESYSINRTFVDGMLAQEGMTAERMAPLITSFHFRLPENARMGFNQLSREQLNDIVLHVAALQKQEIIRMPRFYREQAASVMAKLSNAPPRVATSPVVVSNAPPVVALPPVGPRIRRSSAAAQNVKVAARPPVEIVPPPVKTKEEEKPYSSWLAVSGWVVAAGVVVWAIKRRS
jgi:hypothetical protein